ncbi:glycosyltransferase [Leisingera sp. S232]|uniref:glycosyltransferase n=1 Tax=Leisingera sp. S232 TaxID=3415132 RepID=UPI003C7BC059
MDIKLRMIGLVRFSVLSTEFFDEDFQSLQEKADHLYAPERMELRFRLFENLCLRSLTQQSDSSFRLIVLTSSEMPERYLERLLDLTEPFRNVYCHGVAPGPHYKQIKEGYGMVQLRRASHRAFFRLDDDDAMDRDFVKRTKELARGLIPLQGQDQTPFAIAHNRGFYLEKTAAGPEVYDTCEWAPLSTGLSVVAPVSASINPYSYNHRKFAQHINTYSDISVPSFLRSIHGDNMSNPAKMGNTRKSTPAEVDSALEQHFGFDRQQLERLVF